MYLYNTPTLINFANTEVTIQPEVLKITLSVTHWQFASSANMFELDLAGGS